jgi:hypothetical protein
MMKGNAENLYHHLTASNPYPISDKATSFTTLNRLAAAGFEVDVDDGRLKVVPAGRLTAAQRDYLHDHKAALVAALAAVAGRWCVEYPRSAVATDSGSRLVADYWPAVDWRRVSREYPGAAVWPVPDGFDVAVWIREGTAPP